jgi:threonine synthase
MFYFFFAYKALKSKNKELVFSVPSGNFGNICAGIMAQKLGLPIKHFVAATNVNDTVPNYLVDGTYTPKPSKATISNAMDVGNPSNFIRIRELFNNDLETLKNAFSSYSFTDDETRETMKKIYDNSGYVADPHGAVGYLGLKKYGLKENEFGVFLETAHPVKFLDVVESTLPVKVEIPEQIQKIINNKKIAIKAASYEDLKAFLMKI